MVKITLTQQNNWHTALLITPFLNEKPYMMTRLILPFLTSGFKWSCILNQCMTNSQKHHVH